MDLTLRNAALEHLTFVPITRMAHGVPLDVHERAEYAELRGMYAAGQKRPLAARLLLLVTLGWRRTEIAEAMDVSRVTLNTWLRDNTSGVDTFKPYGPDALEGDIDSFATEQVNSPILNRLAPRNAEELVGVRFVSDRFVVPDGFWSPLNALWRIAYRARGAENTKDDDVAAAADALDILISLFLRRGVTNFAIAHAASVTHRAVLDRMNRARARGILMQCDLPDGCEAFHGERELVQYWLKKIDQVEQPEDWFDNHPTLKVPNVEYAAVRATSTRSSRYWLQTLVSSEHRLPVVIPMTAHRKVHAKLYIAQLECWDNGYSTLMDQSYVGELWTAAMLGRMSDAAVAGTDFEMLRGSTMFVPLPLLYTEHVQRAGYLPDTPLGAMTHIPPGIWKTYFEPFDLVKRCFLEVDQVLDEYGATTKHADDAKTRTGYRAS